MRSLIKLGGYSAILAALLAASQPWDKPAAGWTREDADRLLSSSPWVLQTGAVMEDPRDRSEAKPPPNPNVTPAGLAGANNPGSNERWDGPVGRNRMGHLPIIPVTVRWESALPVREALQRQTGGVTAGGVGASNDYVISVQGLVPAGSYRPGSGKPETSSSSSDNAIDSRNSEELLEGFMAASRLRPRGALDIRPENVKLDAATGEVRIYFPRARPIEGAAKDVLFVTRFGDLMVEAKFHMAAMKYQGKLEL